MHIRRNVTIKIANINVYYS